MGFRLLSVPLDDFVQTPLIRQESVGKCLLPAERLTQSLTSKQTHTQQIKGMETKCIHKSLMRSLLTGLYENQAYTPISYLVFTHALRRHRKTAIR